jgi:segregation and condensation protein A
MTASVEQTSTFQTVVLDETIPNEENPSQLFLGLSLERADEKIKKVGKEEYLVDAFGDFESKDADGYMPTMDSDRLRVGLPQFEGPLDLLLFLIRRHAMDIFDIPIVTITNRYLEVIDRMKQTNLEVAGDFLVMAATLMNIKSKMLLPREERPDEEDEDDGVDPRWALVKRLLDYQRYKKLAKQIGEMQVLGRDVFERPWSAPTFVGQEEDGSWALKADLVEVEVDQLAGLLREVLEKRKIPINHEVIFERISVGARINDMVEMCRMRQSYTFSQALKAFNADNRNSVIVTFLSVLEMAKMKLIKVAQDKDTGTILIISNQENLVDMDENSFDLVEQVNV